MLGKIRIIKRGSGLVRIIECSLSLLLQKGFRAYQNTQHLPNLTAEVFEFSKDSNYRGSNYQESTVFELFFFCPKVSKFGLQKLYLCSRFHLSIIKYAMP